MLNSVVKISMMSVKYFEYYTIILRGRFFRGHAVSCISQVETLHQKKQIGIKKIFSVNIGTSYHLQETVVGGNLSTFSTRTHQEMR